MDGENLYEIWFELNDQIKDLTREEAIEKLKDYKPCRLIFRMGDACKEELTKYDRLW